MKCHPIRSLLSSISIEATSQIENLQKYGQVCPAKLKLAQTCRVNFAQSEGYNQCKYSLKRKTD